VIALITNKAENFQDYNFVSNYDKNYKKEINKCFNYNIENHPNFFLNQLHYQSKKIKVRIDHYDNIKNKNKIKLFIFLNIIKHFEIFSKKPKILLIMEYKSIKPILYKRNEHRFFDKIFTFENNLIDNKKYFFFNGLQVIPKRAIFLMKKKRFEKCIFFANKPNKNINSYFSKRLEIINYYKNQPKKLSLYGSNWDKLITPMNATIGSKIFYFIIKKIFHVFNFKIKKYNKIWKGVTKNLVLTTSKYKFCFIIENSPTLSGRIFLSFFSGTIPVYFGNISKIKLIPKTCYINFKNYKKIDKLENFIGRMSKKKYLFHQKKIKNFLRSKKYQKFSVENDAYKIFMEVKNLLFKYKKI